jgi:hypothetical protein
MILAGHFMQTYEIKNYHKGFEHDQARIGTEVARNWIWPYAYSLEDLIRMHASPDTDPDTRQYCFLAGEMVGYIVSEISRPQDDSALKANLDFPRMLPGHEPASELLIEKAFETLKKKGVSRISGRVTTMCPKDILLAEKEGLSVYDWGYKIYYSFNTDRGKLNIPYESVEEVDPEKDLAECAEIAAKWYKRPSTWCLTHLQEWHNAGIITHTCIRKNGIIIAACMVAPNEIRTSTAAIHYIYSPEEQFLRPMLINVVNKCVDYGVQYVIADLINEHRFYEPVYQELGFAKVADWARCEKELT